EKPYDRKQHCGHDRETDFLCDSQARGGRVFTEHLLGNRLRDCREAGGRRRAGVHWRRFPRARDVKQRIAVGAAAHLARRAIRQPELLATSGTRESDTHGWHPSRDRRIANQSAPWTRRRSTNDPKSARRRTLELKKARKGMSSAEGPA